jgi:predicted peptidase
MSRPLAVLASLSILVIAGCRAAPIETLRFERAMADEVDGQRLSYLLQVPDAAAPAAGWPLLLFLHGAGERGDDLTRVEVHGPPKLRNEIPTLSRCVLVTPQCPAGEWWQASTLEALVDDVRGGASIDEARLYVTGLSMGGYGTFALLARAPELFAAAAPICGGGDPGRLWSDFDSGFDLDGLLRARDVPIHVFHGEADAVVPVQESIVLARALEAVDADIQLTIYPGVGHDAWTRTYANHDLYEWLFTQRRERTRHVR